MKKPTSVTRGKSGRKSCEELNQGARDRKRQKKYRDHTAGSRANSGDAVSAGKKQSQTQDLRVGDKKLIPLSVNESSTPAPKQHKPKSEKPMLSPQAELELLENDERLDVLLERLEEGGTLNAEEQSWVDTKLDRIDELMQQLGLSYDDEDEEEEERQEDMMRLLKGGNQHLHPIGFPAPLITLLVICYLLWLLVKLRRLPRCQKWLCNQFTTRGVVGPGWRTRRRHHRKE